jgi:hypothetical protein
MTDEHSLTLYLADDGTAKRVVDAMGDVLVSRRIR